MNNYSVDRILAENTRTVLPECTFCKSRCWECIYFETDAPDSKGQCRCDFHGRWYYPTEGCGNGVSRREPRPQPKPAPIPDPDPIPDPPRPRPTPTPAPSHSSDSGGSILGVIILFLVGGWMLFSMGVLKPTITLQLDNISMSGEQYVEYAVNIVRMDDGVPVYPKNFKGYEASRETFDATGKSEVNLAKGEYDVWISYDSVSGYSCSVDVGSFFDKSTTIATSDLESGAVNVALLRLQSGFGRKNVVENLKIEDGEGNLIPCTAYGEDGQYTVVIPDTQVDQGKVCVTVYAEGYEAEEIELDFSESRITEVKVKLTAE